MCVRVCACVCACMRACVRACVCTVEILTMLLSLKEGVHTDSRTCEFEV
jgi:hypothetical protein